MYFAYTKDLMPTLRITLLGKSRSNQDNYSTDFNRQDERLPQRPETKITRTKLGSNTAIDTRGSAESLQQKAQRSGKAHVRVRLKEQEMQEEPWDDPQH